jgi:hypothetical protein
MLLFMLTVYLHASVVIQLFFSREMKLLLFQQRMTAMRHLQKPAVDPPGFQMAGLRKLSKDRDQPKPPLVGLRQVSSLLL